MGFLMKTSLNKSTKNKKYLCKILEIAVKRTKLIKKKLITRNSNCSKLLIVKKVVVDKLTNDRLTRIHTLQYKQEMSKAII